VKIFSRFNPSKLRLPKLHSWRYHIIPAIRRFGAINGFTTETYETLHKFYVKNPYRKSNKKEVMKQILNKVRYITFSISQIEFLFKYFLYLDPAKSFNRKHKTS
jgi:hypothetical protein